MILNSSVESRKSAQTLSAPGKEPAPRAERVLRVLINALFTLLGSCLRDIRASMPKTNQVITAFLSFLCTPIPKALATLTGQALAYTSFDSAYPYASPLRGLHEDLFQTNLSRSTDESRMIPYFRLYLIFFLLLALSACTTLSGIYSTLNPWHSENKVNSIAVYVKPDPELLHAVNIDVVFIYTDTVHAMLAGLDAIQWFQQKGGVIAGYSTQLDIMEWQMVSGYGVETKSLPKKHKDAIAVMAFAYSPDNPNAKAVLTELSTPWLVFESKQLKTQLKPPVSYNNVTTAPPNN